MIDGTTGGGLKKVIDLFEGSEEMGFQIVGSFDSITDVANHIDYKYPGNLTPFVDSGKIYKKKYKFISRRA